MTTSAPPLAAAAGRPDHPVGFRYPSKDEQQTVRSELPYRVAGYAALLVTDRCPPFSLRRPGDTS